MLTGHVHSTASLRRIHWKLGELGLAHRLGWLAENVLQALDAESKEPLTRPWRKRYLRTALVLKEYLSRAVGDRNAGDLAPDVLDGSIRSGVTLAQVRDSSSEISQRWNIVTHLKPEDFARALRDARAGH